jgi:hypothetical protein
MLHIACGIRQNAGRIESYVIRLTLDELRNAGVAPPAASSSEAAADLLRRIELRAALRANLQGHARRLASDRIKRRQQTDNRIASEFERVDRLLSPLPESIRESRRYVPARADIQKASLASLAEQADALHRNSDSIKVSGTTVASESAMSGLTQRDGSYKATVRAGEFDSTRFGAQFEIGKAPPTTLIRMSAFEECERTSKDVEHCLGQAGAEAPAPEAAAPAEITETGAAAAAAADIPGYVMDLLRAPASDGNGALKLDSRPTPATVQDHVNRLELRGGPADSPAYYDFHHLQIAFDHVWTESFDQALVEKLKDLYRGILEIGGDVPGVGGRPEGPESSWFSGMPGWFANNLLDEAERACSVTDFEVPAVVVDAISIAKDEWNALTEDQRDRLESICEEISAAEDRLTNVMAKADADAWRVRLVFARDGAKRILEYARRELSNRGSVSCKLQDLLADIRKRIKENYLFEIYAAAPGQRSVNFGILVTYRQKWQPLNYQAGELAGTIPLAPKEVRRFNKRQVIKRSRVEKEIRNNLRSHREDSAETSRAEAEIINKANSRTAFQLGTQTGANVGFNTGVVNGSFNGGLNADFSKEVASISEEVKREFREAVFKASQEYKEERTIEVTTEATSEIEVTESGEISNPNEELTVTYLFYELQRRYRVSEQIHRVTPVVLVAQEVPSPDEIDDPWIVAHDWILRRVLLDDSFRPALTYLASQVRGDEYSLEEFRKNMERQRRLTDEIKEELLAIREQSQGRYTALETALSKRASAIEVEAEEEGLFEKILEFHKGEEEKPSPEAARVREDAARDAYERAAREEKELRSRLDREVTALQAVTEQYTKLLSEHLNRRAQIDRLRLHIKQNILYYMQSIWSYEPPDQRFFRLHRTAVPKLNGELVFTITSPPGAVPLEYDAHCELDRDQETATLAEVANLDQVLGYKGNYMLFPLTRSNCLTDFMMAPYVDSELGLHDPDELGNWTLESFSEYVCCLKERLAPTFFNDPQLQERLRRQYLRLLESPRRQYEDIIVPSGELFIEALPGTHPLLEDFKLRHRAMDVEKVRAEVLQQQLENVRLAARLLAAELDDPKIDKKVVVEGASAGVVIGTDGGG